MNKEEENTQQIRTMCENIRMLRERRNLSIRELSKQTGISESVLRRIENGRNFGFSFLLKLCRYYDLKPYQIFLPIKNSANAPPDFTE